MISMPFRSKLLRDQAQGLAPPPSPAPSLSDESRALFVPSQVGCAFTALIIVTHVAVLECASPPYFFIWLKINNACISFTYSFIKNTDHLLLDMENSMIKKQETCPALAGVAQWIECPPAN